MLLIRTAQLRFYGLLVTGSSIWPYRMPQADDPHRGARSDECDQSYWRHSTLRCDAKWAHRVLETAARRAGASKLNAQVQNGATALHMVATEGKRFCLEALLQARADVNRTDLQLCTPLYLAALNGRETCVKSLLAAGADPSIASDDGSTALDVAREEGYQQCIEALENHLRS